MGSIRKLIPVRGPLSLAIDPLPEIIRVQEMEIKKAERNRIAVTEMGRG